MVTIRDVAVRAGVGAGTVSRVLNGSPRVSPPTRERVAAAIEELGYRPNPLARGLSRGRCQTLGVIVPFFTHASAVERLRGVVAALDDSRYDLVLLNVESPIHRDEHFATLTRRDRADGLLVLSLPPRPADIDRLTAAGVPVVLIDARAAGVPSVATDDAHGGRMATQLLVDLGHEHIAFIGEPPDNPLGFVSGTARQQGYAAVLAAAGLTEVIAHGRHDRRVAQHLTADLLQREPRPTAIFASSDVQAIGVLAGARAAGLRVPDALSVVGFDDIEISAYAGLTTVRQPLFESGRLGTRLLLDALNGDGTSPADIRVHELPLELVERETTGPAPRRGRRNRQRPGRGGTEHDRKPE